MTALVLIDLTVHDLPAMTHYEGAVIALAGRFGGKPLVKELHPEIVEGQWSPTWLVVLEFPNRQAVRDFYDAPDYQPLKAMRQTAATSNGLIVVGE
ncbi:DUF1330 domain-containing protein [Rhizobium sp. NFR03]|uniref:DUF1330 domain-containing protein n=1 Tax=Rhizobium sp. NFR03 TaxID=1566263 RepID=UPI0008C6C848|nr:DUF1330 domain-containing protein [Rhizobium sp. NFR03]RYE67289.1 MAG: DUF1330 domain-containing protein [Rhizobiaceae bacterium]SES47714.1 Uncharacterized conserved protein, DUF1330 family [Rhizobium sp. NFR03]